MICMIQKEQNRVINRVIEQAGERKISFDKATHLSKAYKEEKVVKSVFIKELGFESWDLATKQLPDYAQVNKLKVFHNSD